jgi:hypothetical protein
MFPFRAEQGAAESQFTVLSAKGPRRNRIKVRIVCALSVLLTSEATRIRSLDVELDLTRLTVSHRSGW